MLPQRFRIGEREMKQEGDFELLESEKAKLISDEITKGLNQDPIQLQYAKEEKNGD